MYTFSFKQNGLLLLNRHAEPGHICGNATSIRYAHDVCQPLSGDNLEAFEGRWDLWTNNVFKYCWVGVVSLLESRQDR